jgi:hypothetical protein
MSKRVCTEPGCPALVKSGRCVKHERPNANARGYGPEHQRLRQSWQRVLDSGQPITCWRPDCDTVIDPSNWHLGHDDADRNVYRGPECVPCNTATASRHISPGGYGKADRPRG